MPNRLHLEYSEPRADAAVTVIDRVAPVPVTPMERLPLLQGRCFLFLFLFFLLFFLLFFARSCCCCCCCCCAGPPLIDEGYLLSQISGGHTVES